MTLQGGRAELEGLLGRVPRGTTLQRRAALLGGLGALATVNYLDLVGVLSLGLSTRLVADAAVLWVIGWTLLGADLEDLKGHVRALAVPTAGTALVLVAAAMAWPEVGGHYLIYATPPGQVALAVGPVVANPLIVLLVVWAGYGVLSWVQEWRYLRRTTPEERVLDK